MESDEIVMFAHSEVDIVDEKFDANEQVSNNGQIESTETYGWPCICRVCAKSDDNIIPIFEAEGAEHEMIDKIHKYLPIRVDKTDTLPIQLCYHCAATILAWDELLTGCLDAQKQLLKMQSDQNFIDSTKTKYTENVKNELADNPEPIMIAKQESTSTSQQDEETEHGDLNKGLIKRFDDTRDAQIEIFLKKGTRNIKNARKISRGRSRKLETVDNQWNDESLNKNNDTPEIKRHVINCNEKNLETRDKKDGSVNMEEKNSSKIDLVESKENSRCLRNYSCDCCDYTTRRKTLLTIHTRKYHKETPVNGKRKKLRNVDEDIVVKARIETNNRVYYHCKDCGKNISSPYTFASHVRIHTGEKPFICHQCGKQFRINQGLDRHLQATHAGIKKFSCDICSRMFTTKLYLENHLRIHTGERPFVCNVCGKAFKQRASLFVHNRSHTDFFPFKCNYCDQSFRARPPLIIHLTKHTGEKSHMCDICNRWFRLKYDLKRHRLIHFDEKPWKCDDCGLDFRQKRYMVKHMRTNHVCSKITKNQ